MAKGDKKKVENAVQQNTGVAQQNLNLLTDQQRQQQQQFQEQYNQATALNQQQNQGIQSQLNQFNTGLNTGPYNQFLSSSGYNLGGNTSSGNTSTGGDWKTMMPEKAPATKEEAMKLANQIAYNGKDKIVSDKVWDDYDKDPEYYFKRMLGWQAGGADTALSGPYAGQNSGSGITPQSGYANFASTGGFSPQDISNIRARGIAPIRGIFDSAKRETARAGRLNPGLANIPAAMTKLAREQSYASADAATNVEAAIAQMVQQGKLAGLSGLTQNRGMDLSAISDFTGKQLQGIGENTRLYGTTPAQSALFGSQVLNSGAQGLQGQSLQNQVGQMGITGALNAAQVPSNFETALGRVGTGLKIGGQVASAAAGLPTYGGGPTYGSGPKQNYQPNDQWGWG